MTRWGGALLLSVLWVLACRHARDVEEVGAAKAEPKQEAPAERAAAKARKSRQADTMRPAAPGRPALSSSPEAQLLPEGPMRIQKKLADLGHYSGEATGELDARTKEALKAFQGEHGLAETGFPDEKTVEQLGLEKRDVFRN